jgi:PAS domain-containing protein
MARELSLPRRGTTTGVPEVGVRAGTESPDALSLEAVLREAPIGVVVLDRDLRIERASRTAESDGPITAADAGRHLSDVWPGVPDDVIRALRRVACGRASHVEMRSESPDWRADRMVISSVTDAAGTVARVVWMWTDLQPAQRMNGAQEPERSPPPPRP